jgi:hypothetical protein
MVPRKVFLVEALAAESRACPSDNLNAQARIINRDEIDRGGTAVVTVHERGDGDDGEFPQPHELSVITITAPAAPAR